jgi:hypothetical protein
MTWHEFRVVVVLCVIAFVAAYPITKIVTGQWL